MDAEDPPCDPGLIYLVTSIFLGTNGTLLVTLRSLLTGPERFAFSKVDPFPSSLPRQLLF